MTDRFGRRGRRRTVAIAIPAPRMDIGLFLLFALITILAFWD